MLRLRGRLEVILVASLLMCSAGAVAQGAAPRVTPTPMPTYQFPERQLRYDPLFPRRKGEPIEPLRQMDSCESLLKVIGAPPLRGWEAFTAGSAYEEGRCVDRDWNLAERYYGQALKSGLWFAAGRLSVHYANVGADQDLAAAMWWAHRGDLPLVAECRVKGFGQKPMKVDEFVDVLARMPAARLKGCVYDIAFMAGLFTPLEDWRGFTGRPPVRIELSYKPKSSAYRVRVDDDQGQTIERSGLASMHAVDTDKSFPGFLTRHLLHVAGRIAPAEGIADDWVFNFVSGLPRPQASAQPSPPASAAAMRPGQP